MQYDLLIRKLKTASKAMKAIKDSKVRYGYGVKFMMLPSDWKKYSDEVAHVKFNWKFIKYSRSKDEPVVSDNTPGIYLFVLKPPFDIFEDYSFVMYVGHTKEGLKERLRNGYRTPSQIKPRVNIMRLILDYGGSLYWHYAPFPGLTAVQLKKIETSLIGYFGDPPINSRDEPTEIADAKKGKLC